MWQVDVSSCRSFEVDGAATRPSAVVVEARESKKQKIEKALGLDRVPTLLLNVRQAKPLEALELLRNN